MRACLHVCSVGGGGGQQCGQGPVNLRLPQSQQPSNSKSQAERESEGTGGGWKWSPKLLSFLGQQTLTIEGKHSGE